MIHDTHRTGLMDAVRDPNRRVAMRSNTVLGIVLVILGFIVALASFVVPIILALKGATFDKWLLFLAIIPLGAGVFLAVLGGLTASGQYVKAGLRDIRDTVLPFVRRKNGT